MIARLVAALVAAAGLAGPAPDVPNIVANPSSGPATSTIAVTAHFPYADCPMNGDPSVVFTWDGVTSATARMNGRCDVEVTLTPPSGAGPGVHAVDATVVNDAQKLTARGLFTVEAVPAASARSTQPAAEERSRSSRYALFALVCAALVALGLLRWRRAMRRRPRA